MMKLKNYHVILHTLAVTINSKLDGAYNSRQGLCTENW